ncbi:magnesium/cobalt transporter CorA [Pedobacter glucosidilyticus]|uniref:magnesium/cobalt transporter CorA n=1 Tax=Pedobacter glucosidilyticus TaxID=1122941 RepID=UPI0026ECA558|nr:magnesium/cobalt transporter CorA [Pedobacter glucosidilyticus]
MVKTPQFFNIKAKQRRSKPGEVPGTFVITENALASKIVVYAYHQNQIKEFETLHIDEAFKFIQEHPDNFYWIDIKGLGSQEVLNQIQQHYNINALVMEDIVNTYQRPKCDDYDDYMFITSRMLELDSGLVMRNEQLSFLIFKDTLITFQEDYQDVLEPVRVRLKTKVGGNLRSLGPSYLLYALMDTVIDHYFTIVNRLGDELEIVEEHLYQRPHKLLMYRILGVKKIMIAMRRAAWPERDKLIEILKKPTHIIHPEVAVFFKDAYDHSVQIIDLIESYKETSISLMDVYLSLMSNKMNEVMKFLTVISSLFIPLTFIVGVYGMNFSYQDPKTGEILPYNMPELYMPHGYIMVCLVMLLIVIGQLWYFGKKGWFKD